ncbi:MAG: SOS response-associated peptidase [Planctomycetota bacterium]
MCGRFTQRTPAASWTQEFLPLWSSEELAELSSQQALAARYNIAPTQTVPCVMQRPESAKRTVEILRWGLLPFWATDLAIGARAINARSESAHEKSTFRQAFSNRRCVIPTDGYFEWQVSPDGKQPYYTRRRDDGMLAMAGLWERNDQLGEDGQPILSFTVLTTNSNEATRHLHDRMPVFLRNDQLESWLDPQLDAVDRLREMLQPAPNEWLESHPVSKLVNSPKNDSAECIERIQPLRQRSLFE